MAMTELERKDRYIKHLKRDLNALRMGNTPTTGPSKQGYEARIDALLKGLERKDIEMARVLKPQTDIADNLAKQNEFEPGDKHFEAFVKLGIEALVRALESGKEPARDNFLISHVIDDTRGMIFMSIKLKENNDGPQRSQSKSTT